MMYFEEDTAVGAQKGDIYSLHNNIKKSTGHIVL